MSDLGLILLFGAVVIAVVFLVLSMIMNTITMVDYSKRKRKIFEAFGNIILDYYNEEEKEKVFNEIELLYAHLINKNPDLKREYSNRDKLMGEYITYINENEEKFLVSGVIQDKKNIKEFLVGLIKEYHKRNPMQRVNGANSVLLHRLIESHKNKIDDFDELMNQLANEIIEYQNTIFEKNKKSKRQDIISVVSIILTVVFGLISIILAFK